MKNNVSIPTAIVIAGIIIAIAIITGKGENSAKNNGNAKNGAIAEKTIDIKPVNESDHIMGNPDAELAIIEFSDTECPFCKRFHNTVKQVMDENGKEGNVKWVYRHFPLDSIHSKARKEAEATECAAELGGNEKFWKYIDRLFEITPSNNRLDLAQLPEIAEYAGLDKTKFEECLSSGRNAQKVEDDYQDGIKAGVRGTPYSVIINKKTGEKVVVGGAFPYIETNIGFYNSLSETQRNEFCEETSDGTNQCGIKIAIDKLLSK